MATPLKINNVGGTEIKQFTTAEENYIAYQIGLYLLNENLGQLSINPSYTDIGSYTNNFYNEPVGTHPSTSITSGSTTTTLRQFNGLDLNVGTDSDYHEPLMWVDSGGQTGFKEMPTNDKNEALDRYLTNIFTNDYPGVFKLATSSPGPDYSIHISNWVADTRTDGTSVAYNIYRRTSYTAPTAVRPLYVRDSGGFDGIQAMTDRQIRESFGGPAKNRAFAYVGSIGSYQLRSSAQGAPTDPGTWISAGTATDTQQTTSDQSFTTTYTTSYDVTYTREYTKPYSITYTRNRVILSPVTYTGPGVYQLGLNYANKYTIDPAGYEGNAFNALAVFAGTPISYTREFNLFYVGNYSKDNAYGNFYANYEHNYTKQPGYSGPYPAKYLLDRYENFIQYVHIDSGSYVQHSGYYQGYENHTYSRAVNYTGNLIPDFYQGSIYQSPAPLGGLADYTGPTTTYTGSQPIYTGLIQDYYILQVNYTTINPVIYTTGYQRETGIYYSGSQRRPVYITNYTGPAGPVTYLAEYYYATDRPLAYVPNYVEGYYQGAVYYVAPTTFYTEPYSLSYSIEYTKPGLYNATYTPNYIPGYTTIYNTLYTGPDASYVSPVLQSDTYTGEYTTDYTAAYTTEYILEYSTVYTGNFEGLTIDATSQTNETYTLYVRIS